MPNVAQPGSNVNLWVANLTTTNTSSNENDPSIEYQTYFFEISDPFTGDDVEVKLKLYDGQPMECIVKHGDVTRVYTSAEIDLQELQSLLNESMAGDPFEYTFPAIQPVVAVPRGGRRRRRRATKRRRSTKRKSRRRN